MSIPPKRRTASATTDSMSAFERTSPAAKHPVAEPWAQRDIEIAVPRDRPLAAAARLLVRQLTR
jgi:hypothetical protein